MRDISNDHHHGFIGFNIFRRPSEPGILLAVPLVSPLPVVLASGWRFSHAIQMRQSLPADFDMEAAPAAIRRDGYYVFDGDDIRQRA